MTPAELAAPEAEAGLTRWDRMTVRAAWAILLAFTALSSYLNARAAKFDPAATIDWVAFHASFPPVMLVAAMFAEMVALSNTHRPAKAFGVTVMTSIFAVTLVASYVAIFQVTRAWNPHAPEWVNAGLAAVPDLVMVMAGVTVLSLRMRRHGLASAESRTPKVSRLRRLADAATARAEAALTVPESPLPSASVVAVGTLADPLADPSAESPKPVGGPSVKAVTDPQRPSAKASVDPTLEPFMDSANRLAEARLVRGKTATDYAQILRAVSEGWSKTRIKSQYGYSHDTTQAVVDAAATDPAPAHPHLAAVQ